MSPFVLEDYKKKFKHHWKAYDLCKGYRTLYISLKGIFRNNSPIGDDRKMLALKKFLENSEIVFRMLGHIDETFLKKVRFPITEKLFLGFPDSRRFHCYHRVVSHHSATTGMSCGNTMRVLNRSMLHL